MQPGYSLGTAWVRIASSVRLGLRRHYARGLSFGLNLSDAELHLYEKVYTHLKPQTPTPDLVITTSPLAMGANNGKVALVNNTTALVQTDGGAPTNLAAIVDQVGYGTGNLFEGSAAPALTNTTGLTRGSSGCTDTNSNATDFSVITSGPAPTNTPPRNGQTTALTCSCPAN